MTLFLLKIYIRGLIGVSKVFEKVLQRRLQNYLDTFSIICDEQYGFRSKRSTAQAVAVLTENLRTAIDAKRCASTCFLDLKKALIL